MQGTQPPAVAQADAISSRERELERELEAARVALQDALALQEQLKNKLKSNEHRFVLENAQHCASNRQWCVCGGSAVVGSIFLLLGTPLACVATLGYLGGAPGYWCSACLVGISLTLLAALPTYPRLVRFLAGVSVWSSILFVTMFTVAAGLFLNGERCSDNDLSQAACRTVAIGYFLTALVLVACFMFGFAKTLRLRRSSVKMPLNDLWAWTATRIGRGPAAVALLCGGLGVWACAQPEDSFGMPPRAALRRCWLAWRLANLGFAIIWGTAVPIAYSIGGSVSFVGTRT